MDFSEGEEKSTPVRIFTSGLDLGVEMWISGFFDRNKKSTVWKCEYVDFSAGERKSTRRCIFTGGYVDM